MEEGRGNLRLTWGVAKTTLAGLCVVVSVAAALAALLIDCRVRTTCQLQSSCGFGCIVDGLP